MSHYQKVLLAVDFHPDNDAVIAKGHELADKFGAELHLLHVMEPIGAEYTVEGLGFADQILTMDKRMHEHYQGKLQQMADSLRVGTEQQHLVDGHASVEITKLAKALKVDLIVLGTHGQSGLRLLLGSTANSVLHHAHCDVLSVRLKG
ncbi:universal stress protein [Ferrimonas senticii]|uniref:universal stress protein n=1 Tax=Ferrimonas senticii TaxID=394566 RepID=UPI000408C29D|nr:universal stress protein [Ferrimonas senticii]